MNLKGQKFHGVKKLKYIHGGALRCASFYYIAYNFEQLKYREKNI